MISAMQPLLTRLDAAGILSVSIRTIDEKISSGDIPVVRIGRSVRIRPETLERFVDAMETRVNFRRRRRL
jgi:excisionase family DNA binding protein